MPAHGLAPQNLSSDKHVDVCADSDEDRGSIPLASNPLIFRVLRLKNRISGNENGNRSGDVSFWSDPAAPRPAQSFERISVSRCSKRKSEQRVLRFSHRKSIHIEVTKGHKIFREVSYTHAKGLRN